MTVKKKGLKKGTLEFLLSSTGLDDAIVLEDEQEKAPVRHNSSDDLTNSNSKVESSQVQSSQSTQPAKSGLVHLQIEEIVRSPYQPRKNFEPQGLQELAESIKAKGLIQPVIVRKTEHNFELIAGERRWRAAQMAGLHKIPAVVKDVDDETALVMAIVENIQRKDLNPIEEATSFQRLIDEFSLTQQDVAQIVGKSRSAVTNTLRLLGLNFEIQSMLETGKLEMGHARALLSLNKAQQLELANKIIMRSASVRDAEKWVKEILEPTSVNTEPAYIQDPNIKALQIKLSETLGANVAINHEKTGKGRLVINYHSLDELDGIIEKIR